MQCNGRACLQSLCIYYELYWPSKESMQSNLFFVHGGRTCDETSRELVASSMVGFCGATTFYRMTLNTTLIRMYMHWSTKIWSLHTGRSRVILLSVIMFNVVAPIYPSFHALEAPQSGDHL
jgi:hypothetical protein